MLFFCQVWSEATEITATRAKSALTLKNFGWFHKQTQGLVVSYGATWKKQQIKRVYLKVFLMLNQSCEHN